MSTDRITLPLVVPCRRASDGFAEFVPSAPGFCARHADCRAAYWARKDEGAARQAARHAVRGVPPRRKSRTGRPGVIVGMLVALRKLRREAGIAADAPGWPAQPRQLTCSIPNASFSHVGTVCLRPGNSHWLSAGQQARDGSSARPVAVLSLDPASAPGLRNAQHTCSGARGALGAIACRSTPVNRCTVQSG